MLAALADPSHPAVAALLGLGAAGLGGAVVAMAWNVHARQIRLAEQLARRQFIVAAEPGAPELSGAAPPAGGVPPGGAVPPGSGVPPGGGRPGAAQATGAPSAGASPAGDLPARAQPGGARYAGAQHGGAEHGGPQHGGVQYGGVQYGEAQHGGAQHGGAHPAGSGRVNGTGPAAPVVIEGPDTVVAGEQARYRVRPSGSRKVVSWAVGGGSVSQAPDPAHPGELLLIADQPGSLTVMVRVRDGMTERRGTRAVTAVPDMTPAPPFTLRLFLSGWGLVVVAILIAGFAAALDALGNLTSADFIALVSPLAALLAVVAVARAMGDSAGGQRGDASRRRPTEPAVRGAEPLAAGRPYPDEVPVHHPSAR